MARPVRVPDAIMLPVSRLVRYVRTQGSRLGTDSYEMQRLARAISRAVDAVVEEHEARISQATFPVESRSVRPQGEGE